MRGTSSNFINFFQFRALAKLRGTLSNFINFFQFQAKTRNSYVDQLLHWSVSADMFILNTDFHNITDYHYFTNLFYLSVSTCQANASNNTQQATIQAQKRQAQKPSCCCSDHHGHHCNKWPASFSPATDSWIHELMPA